MTRVSLAMPRYWVQEFDTLNEQKSKPGKPVYDHGVTSKLEAKHWDHDWLLGWRRANTPIRYACRFPAIGWRNLRSISVWPGVTGKEAGYSVGATSAAVLTSER